MGELDLPNVRCGSGVDDVPKITGVGFSWARKSRQYRWHMLIAQLPNIKYMEYKKNQTFLGAFSAFIRCKLPKIWTAVMFGEIRQTGGDQMQFVF